MHITRVRLHVLSVCRRVDAEIARETEKSIESIIIGFVLKKKLPFLLVVLRHDVGQLKLLRISDRAAAFLKKMK